MNGLRVLVCFVAVLSLAALSVAHAAPAGESADGGPDCLFLMAVLDRVLELAVGGDPRGAVIAGHMLDAPVPKEVAPVHGRIYGLILDYYAAVAPGSSVSLSVLRGLLSGLNEVLSYADRLSRCSHDPEAARALRVRVSLNLELLSDTINRLAEGLGHRACEGALYGVTPRKDAYSPGERLHVSIEGAAGGTRVELYTWPQLLLVAQTPQCWDRDCSFEVEMPGARSLVERGVTPGLVAQFALVVRSGGSTCLLGLLKVGYRTPSLYIDVPRVVKRGDAVSIVVRSGEDYEVSVFLNGVLVYGGTVGVGGLLLELDTLMDPVRTGLNSIRVCANASTAAIPFCFQSVFTVEPRRPRVEVHLPRVSVSWLGYTTISLVNRESFPVDATVSVNGARVYGGSIEGGGSATLAVFAGYLPVLRVSVDVRLEAAAGGYEEAVVREEVLCVGILPSVVATSVAFVVPLLVSNAERSFVVSIRSRFRAAGLARGPSKGLSRVLQPYALGLGSAIASLYYGLLRRLRVRPPLDHETLREHFGGSVERLPLGVRAKRLLWALLTLVERDLYSRSKPDYGEARELYRGVLSEAEG